MLPRLPPPKHLNEVSARILPPPGGMRFQPEPRKYQVIYQVKRDAKTKAVEKHYRHNKGDFSGTVAPMMSQQKCNRSR